MRDQLFIRERRLRIAIDYPHEAVRRCIVEVPIKFLDVLAVVTLGAGHAEETFLQNWDIILRDTTLLGYPGTLAVSGGALIDLQNVGKFWLIAGLPDYGKGQIAAFIAAAVTAKVELPCDEGNATRVPVAPIVPVSNAFPST